MAISRRLRFEVLRRDGHRCKYCGAAAPEVKIAVDHVIPEALGGKTEASNLVAACVACNTGKAAVAPDQAIVADVSTDQLRWDRAMALAIERRAAKLVDDHMWLTEMDLKWSEWTDSSGQLCWRPEDWKASLLRFRAAGLDDETLVGAITTAMGQPKLTNGNRWRYFCGICWRTIDQLHTEAKEILADQADDDLCPTTHVVALSLTFSLVKRVLRCLGAEDSDVKDLRDAAQDGLNCAAAAYGPGIDPLGPPRDAFNAEIDPILLDLIDRYIPDHLMQPVPLPTTAEDDHAAPR
jgi:hypothetical protein